jgi:hypothetical protein
LHNGSALSEAYVVPTARIVEEPDLRLKIMADPSFDPRSEVLLSQTPTMSMPAVERPLQPSITPYVERDRPDRVTIRVNMEQPGYLVLADIYYPGWKAEANGEETEILTANHAFRAVALEPGKHTVVFEYAPVSFRVGAWTTLGASLALVTCLGAVYASRRQR